MRPKANMARLLEDSPTAIYWIGFLLADGHFTKVGSAIQVSASIQDQEHLGQFSTFVGSNLRVKATECKTTLKNKEVFPQLLANYDIRHNKTYSPPILKDLGRGDDQLFPLFVGFFDGDGCINIKKDGDGYGRLRIHSSWLENLNLFSAMLNRRYGKLTKQLPIIDTRGYASWTLNLGLLRAIRAEATQRALPLLARKWDKVPQRKILEENLVKYIQNSCDSAKSIAAELNMPYGTVYGIKTGRSWRKLNK